MKKSTKIWLGIFTFAPILFVLIYIVGFILVLVTQIPVMEREPNDFPITFLTSFFGILIFLFFAIFIHLGVMIYYIIHASSNEKNDSTKKIMWILLLVFAGGIANILYYFLEIYPIKDATITIPEKAE